jgi:hypothetical protein
MKNTILTIALVARMALAAPKSGRFTALSYNVAGLPQILQGNDVPGDKTDNSKQIGAYFAKYDYDLIHMQEDFNYHASIYATDNHLSAAASTRSPTTIGLTTHVSSGTLAPMLLVPTA